MDRELFERQDIEKQLNMVQTGIHEFSKKTYAEANTDEIVKACGISKGLLFHYFGSKKDYYIYCLEQALKSLMIPTSEVTGDFYEILFGNMENKINLCIQYPEEMHFVNMASKEMSAAVYVEKMQLIQKYMIQVQAQSAEVMQRAIEQLQLKNPRDKRVLEYFFLYTQAMVNKYLTKYQNKPDQFFEDREQVKAELKEAINCMLYGICKEGESK